MKFKNIFKVIFAFLCIGFLIVAPVSIFPLLKTGQQNLLLQSGVQFKGILELWNIDTFEGGSVSRTKWLEKRAIEFEKNNKGVYIVIKNLTCEQAVLSLQNGSKPNMFSFGVGFGEYIVANLKEFNGSVKFRDDLMGYGSFNGRLLAVPYLMGGYALISNSSVFDNNLTTMLSNKNLTLGYGQDMPILPSSALVNNLSSAFKAVELYKNNASMDSFTAYDAFVNGKKFNALLGTQRDLFRCENKINNGSLTDIKYTFLSGFTDLVQYIGINNVDTESEEVCTNFIEFLLSENVQKTLVNINMFSVQNDLTLYSSTAFKEMEQALKEPIKSTNVFCENVILKDKANVGQLTLSGEITIGEAKKKLF